MKKSGLADSPLFPTSKQTTVFRSGVDAAPLQQSKAPAPKKKKVKIVTPKTHDTVIPRHHDTNHDTTVSRYRDTSVEVIRRAVKEFGKEAATHRFTAEEKRKLANLKFAYQALGIRTSENEIARIAINFIIRDYEENGANSILDKVINALNQ